MKVSIIIVSFRTAELTLACIRSLRAHETIQSYEVIVVENSGSRDFVERLHAEYPEIRAILSERNLGFAGANNLAAKFSNADYLLFLNPDTLVLDQAIDELVRYADSHTENGIIGGRTFFPDGSVNPSSCWSKPSRWSYFCMGSGLSSVFRGSRTFDPESLAFWEGKEPLQVDIVTGCYLLIRRGIWEKLGGFDASFFMYGEDADLCFRCHKSGSRCIVIPQSKIIHYGGHSEAFRADKIINLFKAKKQLIFKHWQRRRAKYGMHMLLWGAFNRYVACSLLSTLRPELAQMASEWRQVWQRRNEWGLTRSEG